MSQSLQKQSKVSRGGEDERRKERKPLAFLIHYDIPYKQRREESILHVPSVGQ